MSWETFLFAAAGGIFPVVAWLFFWLREDENPEPKRLIAISFLGGMSAIPLALVLSWLWSFGLEHVLGITSQKLTDQISTAENGIVFLWSYILFAGFAFTEEYAKYFFAHALIFWRRDYDEPADAMMYMITTALGFATVENILYLVRPFSIGIEPGFEISTLRFIGATLLHVLSSAIVGYSIAKSFYRDRFPKEVALVWGLLWATLLHTTFNLLILKAEGYKIELALIFLALAGIFILFAFERIKHTIKRYYA